MTRSFKVPVDAPGVSVNGTAVSVDGHTHAGGSGAPTDATYVVTSANGTLTNERVLMQGTYITITDNGSSTVTIAVDASTTANGKVVARDASGNFTAGTVTAALTGNASTATTLQTSRNINGTAFNGSADITITAAAGTLTGTTLNSTVTASSLTSFGSSPTIATPALTLSTTTSTTEGRIAWDATNDQIEVGTGSALAEFGPLTSATVGANLGTASAGISTQSARADHIHPTTGVVPTTSPVIVADFSKSGTLATGTGTFRWYNDSGSTLTIGTVRASAGTAPTGASLICDVNVNGTTIYSTQANRPTIAAAGNTATGGAKGTTTITNGQYLTVDIDQVGSTAAGSDLVVSIWLSYA